MDDKTAIELGDELYTAMRNRIAVEPPTSRFTDITVDDAYRVSHRILARRVAAGESLVGRKVGLTNAAVQEFFRINYPDFGNLTDAMRYPNGADVPISDRLIQPKIEGEIAFVLKRGLRGPGITSADVLEATDYVAPCFEIVDSRVRDWQIQIADTIADNASSGMFVIGDDGADPRSLDLSACEMTLLADSSVVSVGSGAAALGCPLTCVAWLANALAGYGAELRSGEVILSGSLGPVVDAVPGTVMSVSMTGIGDASMRLS